MGDGEKLLTHLNSALKVLLGLDIFPPVPKRSYILLTSVTDAMADLLIRIDNKSCLKEIPVERYLQ